MDLWHLFQESKIVNWISDSFDFENLFEVAAIKRLRYIVFGQAVIRMMCSQTLKEMIYT